jgi:hypothetical protein
MRKETYLANEIDSADAKAQYDEHAKRILKDKNILAYILISCVDEFLGCSMEETVNSIGDIEVSSRSVRPEAVNTLENESIIPGEGKMYFDIVFITTTKNGEKQKMYINIEAQKSFYPGYDLVTRAIVYPTRLISQQMDIEYTSDNYDGVKKVYSIWLCFNAPTKNKEHKKISDSIVKYSIKPEVLYPNTVTTDNIALGRYDLLSTIMINLNVDKTINSKNKLISMLSTLFSNSIKTDEKKKVLEIKYGIQMSKELESEVASMCNLGEGIAEMAEERGIEKGKVYTLYDLVQSKIIVPEIAAEKLGITVEQLKEDMKEAGF